MPYSPLLPRSLFCPELSLMTEREVLDPSLLIQLLSGLDIQLLHLKKLLAGAGTTTICSQIRLMLPAGSTSWDVRLVLDPQLCFIHERNTGQTGENTPKYYGLATIFMKWIDLLK